MSKIIGLFAVICLATSSIAISSVEQNQTIDIKAKIGDTVLVPISGEIKDIVPVKFSRSVSECVTPQMEFTPISSGEKPKETPIVFTQPYYLDIIAKGTEKYIRLFTPEDYYIDNHKYHMKNLVLRVSYKDGQQTPSPATETYEYVIITTESFYPIFKSEFVDWKIAQDDKVSNILLLNVSDVTQNNQFWVNGTYGDGVATGNHWITPDEQVTASYEMFNDTQAKIRNFLRYCYDNYNTRYVLIGGNAGVVPTRMVSSYAWSGTSWYNDLHHACDMYYACLHKCMNNDTDNKWMENSCLEYIGDDIDWGYDLCVGRALFNTPNELYQWIHKTKAYVNGNYQDTYLKRNIMASRDSGNQITNWTWDYLNEQFPLNFSWVNNQNITHTQWRDIEYYVNGVIGEGIALIHHTGHGGTLETDYKQDYCDNEDTPQFLYTEACHSGDFGTDSNSRMEGWIHDDGCAFAGVANSAYGWFYASSYYAKVMYREMFNQTHGNNTLVFCQAHNDAREMFGHPEDSVFGMIVKSTNFFGDPAIEYQWYIGYPPKMIAVGDSLIFQWTKHNESLYYALQVATDDEFNDVVVNITDINATNYPIEYTETFRDVYFKLPSNYLLDGDKTHFCRVRAYKKD